MDSTSRTSSSPPRFRLAWILFGAPNRGVGVQLNSTACNEKLDYAGPELVDAPEGLGIRIAEESNPLQRFLGVLFSSTSKKSQGNRSPTSRGQYYALPSRG